MLERFVLRVLRVPPEPEPPEGSPGSIQIFRAGKNFYTWLVLLWALTNIVILVALVGLHFALERPMGRTPAWARITWDTVQVIAAAVFISVLVFTFVSQRLNYLHRWYIVTDRSLRIRSGIFQMQELTMTFSNIQEIRVSAGPLQNLLKLADVEVHSAGGGGSGPHASGGHIDKFEGVSNANAIRDLMVERLRQYRDSGLGENHRSEVKSDTVREIEAAQAVLAEVRAWRAQI